MGNGATALSSSFWSTFSVVIEAAAFVSASSIRGASGELRPLTSTFVTATSEELRNHAK